MRRYFGVSPLAPPVGRAERNPRVAVVTLDNLSKLYEGGTELAVKEVSLAVADSEFMVLLGPSGCGKSSVLRMIAGLEPITSGSVAIDGKVMNSVPAKDRNIAMVFQSYALYPHMDVYNNLAFGLRRRGVERAELDRRVHAVAGKLGLAPFLKRKPYALSGGQRQRVALGRAIVRDPEVFLFDEPLSNLDAALRASTRNELIKQQRELATTTIYVTHDQIEAMTMGDRICIMNKGEVIQIGPPLDVYRQPADTFVARFLGSPPMNLIEADLGSVGSEASLRIDTASLSLRNWPPATLERYHGKPLTLGIRPEDLYEAPQEVRDGPPLLLDVRIDAVEPLGAETLLVLALGASGQEIIARVGRSTGLRVGDYAKIALDAAAIHLFDPATGRAIPKTE
jgi:multiple sugar transport system ATP-binding protein